MLSAKPLARITVVEIGHSVAAPYAGLILAELGADVVKVENPKSGDYARGWGHRSEVNQRQAGRDGAHGRPAGELQWRAGWV